MKSKAFIARAAILFLISVPMVHLASGQGINNHEKGESDKRYVSLFDSDELLDVSIYLDLKAYLGKTDKAQSFDADMTMHFSETDSLQKEVTISYRGQSRFDLCRFPPTRITFKKPLYEAPDSGRIKKMKLVNQCQQGYTYGEYVIREYLIYKLYEVLTDTCYRARLVRISFFDTERKRKPLEQYGIFMEPDGMLAERLNIEEARTGNVRQSHMFPAMIDRIAVFNYMIANWDWAVVSRHNIKVFVPASNDAPMLGIPVPFDFDLTGVVNAEYALPPPDKGINTSRDRLFMGICRSRETYMETLRMFLEKREQFYAVLDTFPYLDKPAKKDIKWFLDQFFDQIEKERSRGYMIDTFLQTCKST